MYAAPESPIFKWLSPAHAVLAVVLTISGSELVAVCCDAALKSADLVGHGVTS